MKFTPLSPDSQAIDVSEYNRLLEQVAQRNVSRGVGIPFMDSESGSAGWMPGDVSKMFLIQVSGVVTAVAPLIPVVPAYEWTEVVRVNGAYTTLGDGRSGTVTTFPAFDTGMQGTVPLNIGSTTSAYIAWLSADGNSIEFIGLDPTVSTSSGSGGMSSLTGAKYTMASDPYTLLAGRNPLYFPTSVYDTNSFGATVDFTSLGWTQNGGAVSVMKINRAGYYQVGIELGGLISGTYLQSDFRKGTYPANFPTTAMSVSPFYPVVGGTSYSLGTTPQYLNVGEYVYAAATVQNASFLGFGGGDSLLVNEFWIHRIGG